MSALAQRFLLFHGQLNDLVTMRRTGGFHFLLTGFTLNKQQVTSLVGAVDMGVAGGSTLVALRNNVFANALSTAFVENKVLPHKLVF